jgi:hypothetical protein
MIASRKVSPSLSYTAKYTKIKSGYMGQLVEWPKSSQRGALWKNAVLRSATPSTR